MVILGDFNAKSFNWYKHYKGSKTDAITSWLTTINSGTNTNYN